MTIQEKEQLHDILHDIKELMNLDLYDLDYKTEISLITNNVINSHQDQRLAAINLILDYLKNSITVSENLAYLKGSKK